MIAESTKDRVSLSQFGRNWLRSRYDAAQTNRHNENHWGETDSLSAAAANAPEVRQKLRDRSRYECANNTYADGMVRTLANDVIGRGPVLQVQIGDKEAEMVIERQFFRWQVATRFASKLKTMRMAKARDGEAFAVFGSNPRARHEVQLDLVLYECDQFARPLTNFTTLVDSDGITYDSFGNPISYTLLRRHPGDTSFVGNAWEADTVQAEDVIHLFNVDRPGQQRGIPEITPAIPLYAQLRRYTLAVIAAAESAADIAAYLETQAYPDDPDDLEPLDTIDIEKRMMMTLPRGWKLSTLRAEQPATTYNMFKREIINEIARCLNMPYNVAAGDSSGYNYASGRLDHKTYFKSIRVERHYWEMEALDRTFERWWEEARLIPGLIPEPHADNIEPPRHSWAWDGDEHVDPIKEAMAQETRLRSHTTTLADEYAKMGQDWEVKLEQRSRELKRMAELGLFVDLQPQSQELPQQLGPQEESEA